MTNETPEMPEIPEMIDMVFDLDGSTLSAAYPFALWAALTRCAPQLAEEKLAGVLPLRTAESNEGMLLPKRAKLILRLPVMLAEYAAAALSGKKLDVTGESAMQLGQCKPRPILPAPTVHAQLVTGAGDEILFTNGVNARLSEMGIAGKLICGKRGALADDRQSIQGYSLVVHDLKPEASLLLQYAGLGENRQFGCGIFVPHKVISGLG